MREWQAVLIFLFGLILSSAPAQDRGVPTGLLVSFPDAPIPWKTCSGPRTIKVTAVYSSGQIAPYNGAGSVKCASDPRCSVNGMEIPIVNGIGALPNSVVWFKAGENLVQVSTKDGALKGGAKVTIDDQEKDIKLEIEKPEPKPAYVWAGGVFKARIKATVNGKPVEDLMLKALDSKGVIISPQTLVTDQNGLVNCEVFAPNFLCPTTPNGNGTLEGDARLTAKFFVDADGDNSLNNGEANNGFDEIPIVQPCPQELIPCALELCRILAEGGVIEPGPVPGPTPANVTQVLTRKPDKEEAERAILRAACRFLEDQIIGFISSGKWDGKFSEVVKRLEHIIKFLRPVERGKPVIDRLQCAVDLTRGNPDIKELDLDIQGKKKKARVEVGFTKELTIRNIAARDRVVLLNEFTRCFMPKLDRLQVTGQGTGAIIDAAALRFLFTCIGEGEASISATIAYQSQDAIIIDDSGNGGIAAARVFNGSSDVVDGGLRFTLSEPFTVLNLATSLKVGKILPDEDQPKRPKAVGNINNADYVELASAPNVFIRQAGATPQLFFPRNSYVPILLTATAGTLDPTFTGITKSFAAAMTSHAADVFTGEQVISARVQNADPAIDRSVTLHGVRATPPLTVKRTAARAFSLTVTFQITGFSFPDGSTFAFEDANLAVAAVAIDPNDKSKISGTVTAALGSTEGAHAVVFDIPSPEGRKKVTVRNVFTVYRQAQVGNVVHPGVVQSLIDLIGRPEPGKLKEERDAQVGNGPRTKEQQDRMTAVINADSAAKVIAPWNSWVQKDASLTTPPTEIDREQMGVLIEAAVQIEGNTNRPDYPAPTPDPPEIPLSMFREFLKFLVGQETGNPGNPLGLAGVAAENSFGLLQFNNVRAKGQNFTGGGLSIPISSPVIVEDWKGMLAGVRDIASLRAEIEKISADWRADPFITLINGIRSTQSHYARTIGSNGFQEADDIRVDSVPTDPGGGRAHGQGSQRDVFELLGTIHRLASDVFGGAFGGENYAGALNSANTPDSWNPEEGTRGGLPVMTDDGKNRALAGRSHWNDKSGDKFK